MAFVKAERSQLWLRCALFGPSGAGKTMTALRIAEGIRSRMGGEIAVIDTESRSASKYADRFTFDVDNMENKRIESYIAAMDDSIKAGYKILVIDSLSHAWKELLEEVDELANTKFGGNSWAAWSKGTPKQNKLVSAILNFPGHLIVTMRSKTEWALGEGDRGKKTVTKMGLSPEQGKGIEYEFDLLVEISIDHSGTVTKDRTGKFQDQIIEKPGEEFGEMLYDWLNAGTAPAHIAPEVLNKMCSEKEVEIGNILKSTNDKGERCFREEELNKLRMDLVSLRAKSPKERLDGLDKMLDQQKLVLSERLILNFGNQPQAPHPEQEPLKAEKAKDSPPPPASPSSAAGEAEKKSTGLSEGFKDYIAGKEKEKAAAQTAAAPSPWTAMSSAPKQEVPANDGFTDDIPWTTLPQPKSAQDKHEEDLFSSDNADEEAVPQEAELEIF
jgi:hypothetical protein